VSQTTKTQTQTGPRTGPQTGSHKEDPACLRRCLLCGAMFGSAGPHNRICRRCKSSQVWRQG
jgi:hypothetical protein